MIEKPDINLIVELAMEVSKENPIDFGMLSINEEDSYKLIALNILENDDLFNEKTGHTTMLAIVTKLLVENFVLNLKILNNKKQ